MVLDIALLLLSVRATPFDTNSPFSKSHYCCSEISKHIPVWQRFRSTVPMERSLPFPWEVGTAILPLSCCSLKGKHKPAQEIKAEQ